MLMSSWLAERTGWDSVKEKVLYKQVPKRIGWWYTLGSIALFLFFVQAVTGFLLACSYTPSPEEAFRSVEYIENEMRLGWLIRGMHYRGSSGMVLVVVIHVFRTFCHATYKRPNEVTWMTGVMLLFLTLGMAFTGYLLPWSNISYWATTVAIFIVDSVPLVGSWAARLLGGTEVGAITLTRFYAFHVLLIPGLLVVIVGSHLLLVQHHGEMGPPPKGTEADKETQPFFPCHVSKDMAMWLVALGSLIALARYAGVPAAEPAAPLDSSAVPRPEWYFLFYYQILKLFQGPWIIIGTTLIPVAVFLFLIALPLYDRNPQRMLSRRPFAAPLGVTAAILLVYLTMTGFFSTPVPDKYIGPNRQLTDRELAGAALFKKNSCSSCHSILGYGMKAAPDLWRVGAKRDTRWLKDLLRDPDLTLGKKGAMVTYHLEEKDVDALAAYLSSLNPRRWGLRRIDSAEIEVAILFDKKE